jgi:hypothetical protein
LLLKTLSNPAATTLNSEPVTNQNTNNDTEALKPVVPGTKFQSFKIPKQKSKVSVCDPVLRVHQGTDFSGFWPEGRQSKTDAVIRRKTEAIQPARSPAEEARRKKEFFLLAERKVACLFTRILCIIWKDVYTHVNV